MKVLITGSKGQLGIALNKLLSKRNDIEIVDTDIDDMDITNIEDVRKVLNKYNPNYVINCAAYTKVDECETHQDLAFKVNADGVKNIAVVTKEIDATLIHVSTDYVFDGTKKEAYNEDDKTNPQSVYGKSKKAGEDNVISTLDKYFIVRTAWLYGIGRNFVNKMLELSEKNNSINVVCDQVGSPTSATEVAKVIELLLSSNKYGIYHATCEGHCAWSDFAEEIFKLCKNATKVTKVKTTEYPSSVNRPANSVLQNKKLLDNFNYKMEDWKVAIRKYLLEENKMKRKVLVTGANGYVGRHVVKALLDKGCEVIASDFKFDGVDERAQRNTTPIFSDEENLYEKLGSPDVVVHCAAWTAVDLAEDDDKVEKVRAVNAKGTENIALVCKKLDCKMIYISTDYVFNGQGETPWDPDCKDYKPLNVYGQTKLEGELAVSSNLDKYFIVRIAWVFGVNGKNFIKTMLNVGKKYPQVKVVNDQIGTPTYTYDLARLLVDMAESDKYGYYHATNEGGYISWYDFTVEIFKQAGYTTEVLPVTTEEYGLSKAARPFNSRLDKSKLVENGFKPLPTWQDALSRYLKEIEY